MKYFVQTIIIVVHFHGNFPTKVKGIPSNKLNHKSAMRVLEGFDDVKDEYPFVVSLGRTAPTKYKHRHTCTGSLISEQWVLTAAHCIVFDKRQELLPTTIRYGNMTLFPNDASAKYSKIIKHIPHPSFVKYDLSLVNDIALLLVEKVQVRFYGRVSAVDFTTLVGLPVKYVGMGHISYERKHTKEYREKLNTMHRQIGEAVVVKCNKEMLTQYDLCIRPRCSRKGQTPLKGDSGGPLLQAGQIVGVCSFQYITFHRDYVPFFSNFYTALCPYLNWISEVITSKANS